MTRTITLLACLILVTAETTARAQVAATSPAAGATFARKVTTLAKQGYRLQQVELPQQKGYSTSVRLLMSSRTKAVKLTLWLAGGDQTAVRFEQAPAAVPRDFRHYRVENDLLRVLAAGGPLSWSYSCHGMSVSSGKHSAWLGPDDYFTAAGPVTGAASRNMFRRELRQLLAAGYTLTGAYPSKELPPGAVRAIRIALTGKTAVTLHVGVDRRHRVTSLQRLDAPANGVYSQYKQRAALEAWIRTAAAVTSVRLTGKANGRGKDVVLGAGNHTFALRSADFEDIPGCGC